MTDQRREILVLTIVSAKPYLYEVPHILAMSENTTFKFRFRHKWIPIRHQGTLLPWAKNGVPKDQLCAIMYHEQDTDKFYPVRLCTLQEVSLIGEVYYFRVSLGSLPEIETNKTSRGDQLDEIQTKHRAAIGVNYDPKQPLEHLALITDASSYCSMFHNSSYEASGGSLGDKQFSTWDALYSWYSALNGFREFDFFKIIGVFPAESRSSSQSIQVDERGIYTVKSGQRYSIRLYQRRPKAPATPTTPTTTTSHIPEVYPVKLIVDNEAIRGVDGEQPVLGRYDILEFTFRPTDGGVGNISVLILQLAWENKRHPDALRKFYVSLKITPRRMDNVLAVIFGATLVSLLFRHGLSQVLPFSEASILNTQTFVLFLLGVAVPSVQRAVQSIVSKLVKL